MTKGNRRRRQLSLQGSMGPSSGEAADTVPYFFSAARCAFIASSRVMAASTFSGGKLSMSRFRLIANPINVGRCEQRRSCARIDHTLTQRQEKLVDLFIVQVRRDVLENELARQHAGGKTEIFARLFFVER